MRPESVFNDSKEAKNDLKEMVKEAVNAVKNGDVFKSTVAAERVVERLSPTMHVETVCQPPDTITFFMHGEFNALPVRSENSMLDAVPGGPEVLESVRYVNMDILPDEVKRVIRGVLNLMHGNVPIEDLNVACEALSKRVKGIEAFSKKAEEAKNEWKLKDEEKNSSE